MQTSENDFLFRTAVFSNLILITALICNHTGLLHSRGLLALLLLCYIPCEFGSLILLLKSLTRLRRQRSREYMLAMKTMYEQDIRQEIAQEKEELLRAHRELEQQLSAFESGPASVCYCAGIQPVYTRDLLLNALFIHKCEQARREGIDFQVTLRLDENRTRENEMLVSLFSNLIDNAFLACRKNPDPQVVLSAWTHRNLIQIDLKNSCAPGEKINLFQTSNPNSWKHGFGMQIIQEILEEYGGQLLYWQNGSMFCQEISLESVPVSSARPFRRCIRRKRL